MPQGLMQAAAVTEQVATVPAGPTNAATLIQQFHALIDQHDQLRAEHNVLLNNSNKLMQYALDRIHRLEDQLGMVAPPAPELD